MPVCEFKPGCLSGDVICNMAQALKCLAADLEEIYTLAELRADICNHENPIAREQCKVYPDLVAHGKGSQWAR